jgi:hypothetical protein
VTKKSLQLKILGKAQSADQQKKGRMGFSFHGLFSRYLRIVKSLDIIYGKTIAGDVA